MHLTRPKSSKGRSRPAANTSVYAGDTDSIPRAESPVHRRPDRNLRSQSQPIMWQAGQLSRDEVLHMLQHAPAAPPQSLNKYRVLPSIERRRSEASPGTSLDTDMSTLTLSDDAVLQPHVPGSCEGDKGAEGPLRPKPPDDPGPGASQEAGGLLLAIRAPCGRRFQQRFEPTDTLQAVRASAEARYGTRYGGASIETMDVPRRSFTDMAVTLAQCGIFTRSVLCISLNDEQD